MKTKPITQDKWQIIMLVLILLAFIINNFFNYLLL